MKITKDYIKQVIQEEIQNLQELKPNPQLEGSVHQTYYYNDRQKKYFMISTKKDYASGVARGAFKFCNVLFQILENDIVVIDSKYSGCHESQDYAIADHKRATKAFKNEGARVLSREQIIKIFPNNTAISVPSLPQNTAMNESSMKITRSHLKQIIKEEYSRLLTEEEKLQTMRAEVMKAEKAFRSINLIKIPSEKILNTTIKKNPNFASKFDEGFVYLKNALNAVGGAVNTTPVSNYIYSNRSNLPNVIHYIEKFNQMI